MRLVCCSLVFLPFEFRTWSLDPALRKRIIQHKPWNASIHNEDFEAGSGSVYRLAILHQIHGPLTQRHISDANAFEDGAIMIELARWKAATQDSGTVCSDTGLIACHRRD